MREATLRMATRFTLPARALALLRRAGRTVLAADPEFRRLRECLSDQVPSAAVFVP
jgi:hypothetical protein